MNLKTFTFDCFAYLIINGENLASNLSVGAGFLNTFVIILTFFHELLEQYFKMLDCYLPHLFGLSFTYYLSI
jgi:hypothetical protein